MPGRVAAVVIGVVAGFGCGRFGFEAEGKRDAAFDDAAFDDAAFDDAAFDDALVDSCPTGFQLEGGACVDVDECRDGGACAVVGVCENLSGSFRCSCPAGYEGDGFTCTDIDDCASNPCDPNATCSDAVGGFTCTCVAPLVGDGTTCTACGNGMCDGSEGCAACPVDCGACSATCEDSSCTVTGLRIIEPTTLQDRGAVRDGQVFDRSTAYPSGVAFLARLEPAVVGSVSFDYGVGRVLIEDIPPYARGSNDAIGGALSGIDPVRLGQGTYQIVITPYGGMDGAGNVGRALSRTVRFEGDVRIPLSSLYSGGGSGGGRADAEERGTGAVNRTGNDINLAAVAAAFRFSARLDRNEPLAGVYLELTASETTTPGACEVTLALATDTQPIGFNPPEYSLSSRPHGSSVTWVAPAWEAGQVYRSPNLGPLVAEQFSTGTYDGILFFVVSRASPMKTCDRRVVSWDADPSRSADLVITY